MGLGKSLQNVGKFIFNIKDTPVVRYPLDEELIRKEKIIQAQQQQINARDTQLAKIQATKREQSESKKEEDYTKEVALRLQERQKELRDKRFKHTFSFRHFFNKVGSMKRPTKFGRKIEITDKDDKITMGLFGDIVSTDNGYLIITDLQGNVLHYAKDLPQLIWKPEALSNYMKRKRIPLAVDENMNRVFDFEQEEDYDVTYDEEEQAYKETLVRTRPVKQMLIEREELIREKNNVIERLEKMNVDKDHKILTMQQSIKVLENRANNSTTELTGVIDKYIHVENNLGEMHSKITKLTELKATYENLMEKQRSIIKELMRKLEKSGSRTLYEEAKHEVHDDIEFYGGILPQERLIERVEPEKPRVIPQPGQPIGGK